MSKAFQTALAMIREGFSNALADPTQGPLLRTVMADPEFLALLSDAIAVSGASGVGYTNDGSKLGGAAQLQAAIDYLAANAADKTVATDPVPTGAVQDGDAVVLHRASDGTWPIIDAGLFLSTGPNSVVSFTGTNYAITTADVDRTIIAKASGNCTITLPLHSAQPLPIGAEFEVLHRAGGTCRVVCGSASIILNEASNGEMACQRGQKIRVQIIDPDDWSALPFGATAGTPPTTDTTPPAIESIDPPNGSTILPDTIIRVRFTEGIQPGSGAVTQRESVALAAFTDDGVVDVGDPFGIDPGEISVIGRDLFIPPITARNLGNRYAYRIAAGGFKDFATPTPNNFAGALTDSIIGPFTVAEADSGAIEVVNSGAFVIDPGSSAGARQIRQMSSTPSNADMTIVFATCAGALTVDAPKPNALPTNFSTVSSFNQTLLSNPMSFVAYRTEGGVPSRDIEFRTHFSRRQTAIYAVVRGTGGVLTISTGATPETGSGEEADFPALAQATANELRFISAHIDSKDVTPTYAALTAAGWTVLPPANTGLGSATEGATLVVAYRAQGGTAGQSIDPPALSGSTGVWRTYHVGIKEV